jgi:phage gpG-like protein
MLTVEVEGLEGLTDKLNKVFEALNVTSILDEAEAMLLNRIRARFLRMVDPDEVPWIPSQRYLKPVHKGAGTLFLSGTLFHSIQEYAVGADYRSIGSDVPYGRYHQYGTLHIPKRVFLGVNQDDMMLVEKRILQRIAGAIA